MADDFDRKPSLSAAAGTFFTFRASGDWREIHSLDGRGVFADVTEPTDRWLALYIPPEDQQGFRSLLANCLSAGAPLDADHRMIRADGSIGWVHSYAAPIFGANGRVVEWHGVASDVTRSREEEARQRFLLQWSDTINGLKTAECVMQASASAIGVYLNAGRVRYLEMDESDQSYTRSAEWVNDALNMEGVASRFTLSQFSKGLIAELSTGQTLVVEDVCTDYRMADQADLFLRYQVRAGVLVPLIKDGRFSGALSVHHPTARKWRQTEVRLVEELAERTWSAVHRAKAEASLREATGSLQMALEVADLRRWQLVLPDRVLVALPEFKRLFGVSEDAPFTYPHLAALVHPEDHARRAEVVERAIAEKSSFEVEYRIILDGQIRWISAMGRYEQSEAGERLVGVSHDVTERKKAEEQRRLDAEHLKLIFDSAKDYAIIALDLHGRVTSWNSGAERILGYQEDEALGLPADVFFTPEDVAEGVLRQEMTRAGQFGKADNERWHVRKDGSRFWASGTMVPLQNDHRHGYLQIFRDLTEKRTAENNQRLLVEELNHRVKNTLATVQSITRQTLRGASVPDEVQASVSSRLQALAASHDLLTREHWAGASLKEVVITALAPFASGAAGESTTIAGPDILLAPKAAVCLSIAFHELGTNAVRFGSLSTEGGSLDVTWSRDGDALYLQWHEQKPKMLSASGRRGFGTRMIEEAVVYELQAEASIQFEQNGLRCLMRIPIEGNIR